MAFLSIKEQKLVMVNRSQIFIIVMKILWPFTLLVQDYCKTQPKELFGKATHMFEKSY